MSHRRALHVLLRMYPSEFRASFGDEMLEVFAARCEEVRRERGLFGVLALWARTLPGLVRAAFDERFSSQHPSPRLPRKRRNSMDSLLQDVRYGVRSLVQSPGTALLAVLMLGLGIGITTAVFTLVNAILLRPLPHVTEPSRLVAMFTGERGSAGVSSYMDYLDFVERNRTLEAFAAYKARPMDLAVGDKTDRIDGMMVSHQYFEVLGVEPFMGRFFTPADDDEPGAETVMVLSYDLWQSALAADPAAVGGTVRLNGLPFTVIGVAPAEFRGTMLETRPQVFAPMAMQPHFMPSSGMLLDRRGWGGIMTVGRLAAGVSLQQARDDFALIGEWLQETYPQFAGEREYTLLPLAEATLMPSGRAMAVGVSSLLAVVVGIVLLVACVNVANLMLARGLRRRSEIAVRQALGAGRGRLVRQLLVESVCLSMVGGLVGLMIALVGRGALESLPFPFALDFSLDARILGFSAALALLTGIGFGVVPALATTRVDLSQPMRRLPEGAGGGRSPLGAALVVCQVALSVVLLIAAGLFTRTFIAINSIDLGFEPDEVLVAAVDPSLQGYEGAAVHAFHRELLERAESIPGVRSASLTSALPAAGGDTLGFSVQGVSSDQMPSANVTVVGPRYLETMGIRLLRGRDLTAADNLSAEQVLIVNESAVRQLAEIAPGDPMGLRLGFAGPDGPYARIVGIAADSKTTSLRGDSQPMFYIPAQQIPDASFGLTLLSRTAGVPPQSIAPSVRAAVRDVDPDVAAFGVEPLSDHLAATMVQERLVASLVGFAALLTLGLASIGLYGVLSFGVARRNREMGIRMALGARAGGVRSLIVRQALRLVLVGSVFGIAASLAAGSYVSSFLYGISAADPLTYGMVVGLLVIAAAVASYLPARRATRVDPVIALRDA